MRITTLLPLAALALAACGAADSDGDGLSDKEEEELGTDPDLADSDGDGLDDGLENELGFDPLAADADADGLNDSQEHDAGTDPNNADTDGDGYPDGAEVDAGSDPADDTSVIYQGGWPYNSEKDDMGAPDIASGTAAVGQPYARFSMKDTHGDMVDIYDFAKQGKPVVIDIAAEWCGPCHGMSQWISGAGDSYGFGGYWTAVAGKVDDGTIQWITIIGENQSGGDATEATIAAWEEDYRHELVPVLMGNGTFANKYIVYGWPTVYFLDEDMIIQAMPDGTQNGHYGALDMAQAY